MLIVTIIMGFKSKMIHGGNAFSKPSKGFESEMIPTGNVLSKPTENSEQSSQNPEPTLPRDQPPVHLDLPPPIHKAHGPPVEI